MLKMALNEPLVFAPCQHYLRLDGPALNAVCSVFNNFEMFFEFPVDTVSIKIIRPNVYVAVFNVHCFGATVATVCLLGLVQLGQFKRQPS